MENKIIAGVITAAIVIIMTGALLVPVIDDAAASSDTFSNKGYYYMDHITAGQHDDIVIEYTKSPFKFTYNSTEMDISNLDPDLRYTLVTNAEWIVRFTNSTFVGLQGIGTDFSFGGQNMDHVVMTISNGTINVTAHVETNPPETVSTYTKTYTDLWVYSPIETDWIMKDANTPAYMKTDSVFYAIGTTTISVWNDTIYITGTIDNWEATIIYPPNVTTTTSDKVSVISAVDNHVDLFELDKLTFTINDGTTSKDAIYSYFIVPAEVTAERSTHASPGQAAIYHAIPVIVIVALIVGLVGYGFYRMKD